MQCLMHFTLGFLLIFSIFRIIKKNINFVRMDIHVNNCIMHEDNFERSDRW